MPSPITMEVPMRTKSSNRVFNFVLILRLSLNFNDLSSSGVGNLSLKMEIFLSDGCWLGSRLTFAYLQIKVYKENVPPAAASG